MRQLKHPPVASVLLNSMRAVGYDTAAAIADIIDNSVTAGARLVQVWFSPGRPTDVCILDDGAGMNADELLNAMRHGSRSPSDLRAEHDLGRFGLGLKTASMSQCRRLTVVSRKDGVMRGMVWDLDEVARAEDWVISELDEADLADVPEVERLLGQESGTLVVWQKLDRVAADDAGDGKVFSERMAKVEPHLAMVFHRFMSDRPKPLRIDWNGAPISPVDPFLEDMGSEAGPQEQIHVQGQFITLQAFTLPHISRLSQAEITKAGGEKDLRRRQGFYVYRGRRLIIWGTWFRLHGQEELTKLTRVRVDVPNTLDHDWSLDIKKSAATPPAAIRERLRGLVPKLVGASRRTHEYRGRVTHDGKLTPLWARVVARDGVRYEIDDAHPLISAFRAGLNQQSARDLPVLLKAIAASFPIEALYNDRAKDELGFQRDESASDAELFEQLEDMARMMLSIYDEMPAERKRLLDGLPNIIPFNQYPKIVTKLQKRLA